MKITILEEHGDVEVWTSLVDDDDVDPRTVSESFIIGVGETRDQAVASALAELDDARRELVSARGRPAFPANRARREGQLP